MATTTTPRTGSVASADNDKRVIAAVTETSTKRIGAAVAETSTKRIGAAATAAYTRRLGETPAADNDKRVAIAEWLLTESSRQIHIEAGANYLLCE